MWIQSVQDSAPPPPEAYPANVNLVFGGAFIVFADPSLARRTYAWLERALAAEPVPALRPNRARVLPGGLRAVEEGFRLAREGQVSAEKLVYLVRETDGLDPSV